MASWFRPNIFLSQLKFAKWVSICLCLPFIQPKTVIFANEVSNIFGGLVEANYLKYTSRYVFEEANLNEKKPKN